MKSLLTCFIVLLAFCSKAQKIDTIYTNHKNPVLLIFSGKFTGELGNSDFVVEASGQHLKVYARTPNAVSTFLAINEESGKNHYVVIAFKTTLKRVTYDFRTDQVNVNKPEGKVAFSSAESTKQSQQSGTKTVGQKEEKSSELTSAIMDSLVNFAVNDLRDLKDKAVVNGKMSFKMTNAFVYGDYFVFKLEFNNGSSLKFNFIDFDISIDTKKSLIKNKVGNKKRFTVINQFPNEATPIQGGENRQFILITDSKFYSDKGKISILIKEKNVKRNMSFDFDANFLSTAPTIEL